MIKLKCPNCGKEMEKGKLVMSSWPIGGAGQGIIPKMYWCRGFGILRGKEKVDIGYGMSKGAYICKGCKIVQFKY